MRVLVISDTHGMHRSLPQLPKADVIIHAGDFCNIGSQLDAIKFLHWFNALDYPHRICIGGNHDIIMEKGSESEVRMLVPPGVTYLRESGVTIDGVRFWGSPYTPTFMDWGFMADRGEDIRKHWDLIPNDVDVLITHGPAHGICDTCPNWDVMGAYQHVGCEELRKAVDRLKPRVHLFGHVHYSGGDHFVGADTLSINAAICNEAYVPINKPHLFDIWPNGDCAEYVSVF